MLKPNFPLPKHFREMPDYSTTTPATPDGGIMYVQQVTEGLLRGYNKTTGCFTQGHRLRYRGIQPKVGEYIVYFATDPEELQKYCVLISAERLRQLSIVQHRHNYKGKK